MWNLHEFNFLNSNNEHLKLNTIKKKNICSEFFDCKYTVLKIQLQVFKMKKKFGTSNSIFKIQNAEIQSIQKVGQRSSRGKSRRSPKSQTKRLLRVCDREGTCSVNLG